MMKHTNTSDNGHKEITNNNLIFNVNTRNYCNKNNNNNNAVKRIAMIV